MQKLPRVPSLAVYRQDIDGLRAVAVMIVVFNHLRLKFTGGYVGVDVFFVISGYLISAHIIKAMTAGTFSIVDFYERRIRRIFPALLAMLAFVAVLSYRYLVPSELAETAKSLLAALFSYSNILFWTQAGYFDGPSLLKPLLHTWSLAVEEQFYIIFPLFLLVILKWFPRALKMAIWSATGISFLLACIWVRHDSSTAFFWAPLRAWELLIGTILSQSYLPALREAWSRNIASATGILLILASAIWFTSATVFPGLTALAPCLGAGLLIAAGETGTSVVGRILSWRPIVFVGLISYSLYLWHWPILVFQNTSSMLLDRPSDDRGAKYLVLALSFVAATLSWRFVETPVRIGRRRPGRRTLFAMTAVLVSCASAMCVWAIRSGGIPFRYSEQARVLAGYSKYDTSKSWRQGVCFILPENNFSDFRPDVCLKPDPSKKNYLLFGDSLAADLYPGLVAQFPEIHFMQATAAACRPSSVLPLIASRFRQNCTSMENSIYDDYLVHHRPDAVVLAAGWSESDLPQLNQDIQRLQSQGQTVILFGPVMNYDLPLPRLLANYLRDGNLAKLSRHRTIESDGLDREMAAKARDPWKIRYISVFDDLCSKSANPAPDSQIEAAGCPTLVDKQVPLLFDEHHFTDQGSNLFAAVIRSHHELP